MVKLSLLGPGNLKLSVLEGFRDVMNAVLDQGSKDGVKAERNKISEASLHQAHIPQLNLFTWGEVDLWNQAICRLLFMIN